jgi:hypothetical protein
VTRIAVVLCLLLVVGTAHATQFVVQPYAIARDAWELRPIVGGVYWTNSLTHAFFGADLTYRFASSDRAWAPAALGLSVASYSPFNAGADAHPTFPLNETQLSASAYFAYFPFPAGAVHPPFAPSTFEPYLLGGMGVLRTRPIPVIDPSRKFDWSDLGDVEVGVGGRVFFGRWFAVTLELTDLIYFERTENPRAGSESAPAPGGPAAYDPAGHLTNAIRVGIGASFLWGPLSRPRPPRKPPPPVGPPGEGWYCFHPLPLSDDDLSRFGRVAFPLSWCGRSKGGCMEARAAFIEGNALLDPQAPTSSHQEYCSVEPMAPACLLFEPKTWWPGEFSLCAPASEAACIENGIASIFERSWRCFENAAECRRGLQNPFVADETACEPLH